MRRRIDTLAGRALGAVLATAALSGAAIAVTTAPATASEGREGRMHLQRGQAGTIDLDVRRPGEAILTATVSAGNADWSVEGRESAVVAAYVDGRHVTDIVVPSNIPTLRTFALGRLDKGDHELRLVFDERSPAGVPSVQMSRLRVDVSRENAPEHDVLKHAPILIGRALPALGSTWQNATTDTPLIAWHESRPATTAGHTVVEYSVVWSNEDGGTNSPALMARWGRTTDIEWFYRVELDEDGDRVPGTGVYQSAGHGTVEFTGQFEGDHPLIQVCTSNNNMCHEITTPADERMRFQLDTRQTRPADRSREHLMDTNPWTYQVMAKEMVREGQIEAPSDPATPAVGDQRSYLWVETTQVTGAAQGAGSLPGLAIGVKLRGDATVYRSDHSVLGWTIARDVPAATTVELPVGTTADDVEALLAIRTRSGSGDNGATLTVKRIGRAFFLTSDYLPGPSFLSFDSGARLTAAAPQATIWSR
ncbi:hypothetical protein [Motilibacter aurantiacus]|uniref:hypothetical protein n=1 Tax=Motilibacter aurantiacus TaxID=2714955 RepID=UPI001408CEE0|nr:hypothetical protein [Motilibacter aurantiacus]NHC46873.1 hypothetical protein [Motilibacter aurantiacus]